MHSTDSVQHRRLADLHDALASVREAPRDHGALRLIVRRPAVNTREVLEEGQLDPAVGLVGDTWQSRTGNDGAFPDTQITLMNVRAIAAISPDTSRWPLAGDQLFVDLDLSQTNLPPGTQLAVGEAILEVTAEPHTGCGKFVERYGVDAMKLVNSRDGRALGLRGIYARVVQGGRIRPGDLIVKKA